MERASEERLFLRARTSTKKNTFLCLLSSFRATIHRCLSLSASSPRSLFPPRATQETRILLAVKWQQEKKEENEFFGSNKKNSTTMADASDLLAEKLDLDLNAPGGASSSSSSSSSTAAPLLPLKLTDVPNQVLVTIFAVAGWGDPLWARFTIPYVCKAFRDLYRSRDASPLQTWLFLEKRTPQR
jgi:hypothetical protein